MRVAVSDRALAGGQPKIRRLAAGLATIGEPSMRGAVCAGKSPMFDAPLPGETAEVFEARAHAAVSLCRRCPVATDCHTAAMAIPAKHRRGIWAGVAYG